MKTMNRRQFAGAVSAAPVLFAAGRPRAATLRTQAEGVYERAIVIDALANPGSMNVSWPPRGPLSQKQRDAIATSGITAINVTVSADFEATTRNIALWQGEADRYPDPPVDRPPARRHRAREEGQDARPDARLPEHRHDRARPVAARRVPPARHPHHPAHLQRSQPRRRRLPRAGRRRPERVRTPGGGAHECARHRGGPEPLRHADDGRRHRRSRRSRRSSRTAAAARSIAIRAARKIAS